MDASRAACSALRVRALRSLTPLVLALACAACLGHRQGWGRGSYRKLYESERLQIRADLGSFDPASGTLLVGWVGARAKTGAPKIRELRVVFFDDRDGDLVPARSELVRSWSSQERSAKVLLSHLSVESAAPERLSGEAAVWTADGDLVVRTWRLLGRD